MLQFKYAVVGAVVFGALLGVNAVSDNFRSLDHAENLAKRWALENNVQLKDVTCVHTALGAGRSECDGKLYNQKRIKLQCNFVGCKQKGDNDE